MSVCASCGNTGLVIERRTEPDGRRTEWAKPCSCPSGQAQSRRRFDTGEGRRYAFGVGPYWQGHPGIDQAQGRDPEAVRPLDDPRRALSAKLGQEL